MKRERKNPDWQIRLYRYQIVPPAYEPWRIPGAAEETRAMEKFWNRLVEQARRATEWYQAIISDSEEVVRLKAIEADLIVRRDQIVTEIKAQRITARSKKGTQEDVAKLALAQVKGALKETWQALKAAKAATRNERKAQIAEHHELWETLLREERKTTEIHWGNREYLLDAFRTSLARTRKEGKELLFRSGPLRKLHFRQPYSMGLPVADMFTHQGRVRFAPAEPQQSTRAPRMPMQFKVGNQLTPFTVYYHRPLPPEGRIKYIDVVAEEVVRAGGNIQKSGYRSLPARWEWSVVIAVEFPPEEPRQCGERQEAGIDVGFRIRPEGLRIAMVVAEDGHTQELCLPFEMIAELRKEHELQAQIDALTNQAGEDIRVCDRSSLSEDALAILRTSRPLTRPQLFRLLRLCSGIAPFEERIQRWVHEMTPLYRRIRFDALRRQRRRTDLYRKWAWQLCEDYHTLHIEDIDLSQLQQVIEDGLREDPIPHAAKKYQNLAGLSVFMDTLPYIAHKANTKIVKKNPAHTTDRCAICGARAVQTGALYLECANGHRWDQDINAGQQIRVKIQAPPELRAE